jgi:DNA processing protein
VLDCLTAVTLAFLPPSLQARALADLRAHPRGAVADREPFPRWREEDEKIAARFARAAGRAEQALSQAARMGIYAVPWGADRYPVLLAEIADPPLALWGLGDPAVLATPCLAIVGSRAASPYGLEVASRLAGELAAAGLTIVSGLARGVDSAGHRGTLAHGRTVAVLGSGVDVIYPREHAPLAAEIVARGGAMLSELPPGSVPRREHFPRRNRLISGLSLGVLVIEASERSGSLQTARFAAEQGREVLAVPGSILGERHRGTHALLRDGAILVEQAADVLNEIRWPPGVPGLSTQSAQSTSSEMLGTNGKLPAGLDRMVKGEVYDFQALAGMSGLPADALLRDLLFLELDGRITRTGDGRFLRSGRPVIR